jgi:DTW domain-containing protein YfiP
VIVLHPREARRTVGTARLVKLCLEETVIIQGTGVDLDRNADFAAILEDPTLEPWLLFPGPGASPVEELPLRRQKRPVIVVVDGTWSQASKMIRTSERLRQLRCLRFDPQAPSRYGFRRQPALHCVSTIEAVHEVISRTGGSADAMLEVFQELVRSQTSYEPGLKSSSAIE